MGVLSNQQEKFLAIQKPLSFKPNKLKPKTDNHSQSVPRAFSNKLTISEERRQRDHSEPKAKRPAWTDDQQESKPVIRELSNESEKEYEHLDPKTSSAHSCKSAATHSKARTCLVCDQRQLNTIFFPCAHNATCLECSSALSECPICSTPITKIVKIYF